jgi:uncharacterized protein
MARFSALGIHTLLSTALALSACRGPARNQADARNDAFPAAKSGAPGSPLPWRELNASVFEDAKRTGRYVILDGSAEWCHWCHVMEAVTYHDAAVRQRIDMSFITVKVDVDQHPEIEARYAEYGWPATVIFGPDGTELSVHQGYLAPAEFVRILDTIATAPRREARVSPIATGTSSRETSLAFLTAVDAAMDRSYDEPYGGFGTGKKFPIGCNNARYLERARQGDLRTRDRVIQTLKAQAELLDPEFGGMYQYSIGPSWREPHFEKLGYMQAEAITNYAEGYELTQIPSFKHDAENLHAFTERFFRGIEGGFFMSQDADLNAHEEGKAFLDGHAYYALTKEQRLRLGIPRIDTHENARENALMAHAYFTLARVLHKPELAQEAVRTLERYVSVHQSVRGMVRSQSATSVYLRDQVWLGFAATEAWQATQDPLWKNLAITTGTGLRRFENTTPGGGYLAAISDTPSVIPTVVPVEENITALRFLTALAAVDATFESLVAKQLGALVQPAVLAERGRILGELAIAVREARSRLYP